MQVGFMLRAIDMKRCHHMFLHNCQYLLCFNLLIIRVQCRLSMSMLKYCMFQMQSGKSQDTYASKTKGKQQVS